MQASCWRDPSVGLFAIADPPKMDSAWCPLSAPRPRVSARPVGITEFAPVAEQPDAAPPIGIARDRAGRVWLLDRSPPQLRVLSPDLSLLDTLSLPASSTPTQVVCSAWCVAVANSAELLVQPFGGVWRTVALPAAAVAIAADEHLGLLAVLLQGPRLATLAPGGLDTHDLPELTAPVHALVTAADTVLVGEPRGAPASATETRFVSFKLDPAVGPTAVASYGVRGFDGRALWRDGATVYVSTRTGARTLYSREAPVETIGSIETFALDSTIFACVWHRVFVDACVPLGTSVILEAKTADDLPPRPLWRLLRPPADISATAVAVAANGPWPPLGSLVVDEPGWSPLGVLDVRGPQADIPDPPERIVRPSEEPYADARSTDAAPWPQVTLEGLIKAPPGRYLWLRLRLTGTERRSPEVFAIRASFQRRSLLDNLPAYWRADPIAADATDRALALFEGWTTETNARITILRELSDPRLVPPEALDWLASYVAITFDQRLDEAVRRQLLAEACALYQQRGTVPGLTRLVSILARAPAIIVETFRLRRQASVLLGDPSAIVGPSLQLGDDENSAAAEDPADVVLEADHAALLLRRAAITAAGGTPCPPDDPPYPMETDPLARFIRRFAHRFTVVLPCAKTPTLAAVIDAAVEANKPAHTLHTLCWLDAGFRLGASSTVGLSRLGETPCFEPGLLGTAVLGAANTIGRHQPDGRFHTGQPLSHDQQIFYDQRSISERAARP